MTKTVSKYCSVRLQKFCSSVVTVLIDNSNHRHHTDVLFPISVGFTSSIMLSYLKVANIAIERIIFVSGSKKRITRAMKAILQLYTSSSEVASVLLEVML
ncbi:hypothetical protein BC332_21283 [Capsicum chinense]|nr:hypothetical protein BC332_21283 [Capsicum chinense]